jgi:tetratricopeptide (TPR) repeat protein
MRNLEEAHACLQEGLALARQLEKPGLIASCLNVMADLDCAEGEYHSALATIRNAWKSAEKLGNRYNIAMHLNNLGTVHHLMGDYASAGGLYREAWRSAGRSGMSTARQSHLANIGELAVLARIPGSRGILRQALEIGRRHRGYHQHRGVLVTWAGAHPAGADGSGAWHTGGSTRPLRQTQMYNNHAQAVLFLGEWAEQKQQAGKANHAGAPGTGTPRAGGALSAARRDLVHAPAASQIPPCRRWMMWWIKSFQENSGQSPEVTPEPRRENRNPVTLPDWSGLI